MKRICSFLCAVCAVCVCYLCQVWKPDHTVTQARSAHGAPDTGLDLRNGAGTDSHRESACVLLSFFWEKVPSVSLNTLGSLSLLSGVKVGDVGFPASQLPSRREKLGEAAAQNQKAAGLGV